MLPANSSLKQNASALLSASEEVVQTHEVNTLTVPLFGAVTFLSMLPIHWHELIDLDLPLLIPLG